MKSATLKMSLAAAIVLATSQYAMANPLNSSEISSVRGVLRALNVQESLLSNQDIEILRNKGLEIRMYEESKSKLLQKASDGSVYLTCGGGSHGGDKDPV